MSSSQLVFNKIGTLTAKASDEAYPKLDDFAMQLLEDEELPDILTVITYATADGILLWVPQPIIQWPELEIPEPQTDILKNGTSLPYQIKSRWGYKIQEAAKKIWKERKPVEELAETEVVILEEAL